MNKVKEIATALRAMDFLARCVNNESYFMSWLMAGIADGDCESMNDEELVEYYEGSLKDIIGVFLRTMKRAGKDGGLYIGDVVADEDC